jgi:formylmethanofuran dehydrogenase subunit C
MTSLTLRLHADAPAGLELGALTPSALSGKSVAQLARLRIPHGSRTSALGALFDISGEDVMNLRLLGLNHSCHHVGRDMQAGQLEVRGTVGMELGRDMSGGQIKLRGNAGDGVALGMRGGQIEISGDVGERAGGATPGATRGMNEGTLIVHGNAGAHLGERMRRGLILVGGDCGRYCGDRMIAGSIVIFGKCAGDVGHGMRRGTLMLAEMPQRVPALFNDCGEFELGFVPVFARHVASLNKRMGRQLAIFRRASRWCGDMAQGGHGELLIAGARD